MLYLNYEICDYHETKYAKLIDSKKKINETTFGNVSPKYLFILTSLDNSAHTQVVDLMYSLELFAYILLIVTTHSKEHQIYKSHSVPNCSIKC